MIFNTQTCLGVFHNEGHLPGAETNLFFYLDNTVPMIVQILMILLNIWCEQAKLPHTIADWFPGGGGYTNTGTDTAGSLS